MTKQDFSDLITSEMHHSNIVWSPERLRDLLQKKYYTYDHCPFGKTKAVFTISTPAALGMMKMQECWQIS
jgi:hypothetical protein